MGRVFIGFFVGWQGGRVYFIKPHSILECFFFSCPAPDPLKLIKQITGMGGICMSQIKFFQGDKVPLEMHKVRIVQKLNLLPVEERLRAMEEAGNNTFLLHNDLGVYHISRPKRSCISK